MVGKMALYLVSWSVILLITWYDCIWLCRHPDAEANPFVLGLIELGGLEAAILFRCTTLAALLVLLPFASRRARVCGTAVVLFIHLSLAGVYLWS